MMQRKYFLSSRAALLLAAGMAGCGPKQGMPPAPAGADGGIAAPSMVSDTTNAPLVITLRRDSLGLRAGAPMDSVRIAIDSAVVRLRRVGAFDILAISPAILAVRLRARAPGGTQALLDSLGRHPWVSAAEADGMVRADGGKP